MLPVKVTELSPSVPILSCHSSIVNIISVSAERSEDEGEDEFAKQRTGRATALALAHTSASSSKTSRAAACLSS